MSLVYKCDRCQAVIEPSERYSLRIDEPPTEFLQDRLIVKDLCKTCVEVMLFAIHADPRGRLINEIPATA